MQIENRPAMTSKSIKGHNIRSRPDEGDEGGDAGDLVPGRDIRFTGIMIDEAQINQLVGEQAFNFLFDSGKQPPEPGFKTFNTLWLDTTYKNSSCRIVFGVAADVISTTVATIKNISLKPKTGGVAELACTVVGAFPRDLATLDFESFMGKEVTVSLGFGSLEKEKPKDATGQLPFNAAPPGQDRKSAAANDDSTREADHNRQLEEAARFHERGGRSEDAAA